MGKIINIRKLIALDIALHGHGPITLEFVFGVFGIAAISVFAYASGDVIFGAYLAFLSLNYVPALAYALLIKSQKSALRETRLEMSNLRRYGPKYNVQQLLVFVPLSFVILSIAQELEKS